MAWIRKHRPSPATGIALAALVVALGGVAFAAIPDSSGTIHGCYQKNGGSLRVVESASACRASERPLQWQEGPPAAGGLIRGSGIVRMSRGENANVLEDGPFTWTAECDAVTRSDGGDDTRVRLSVESAEPGTIVRSGVDDIFTPLILQEEQTTKRIADRFWTGGLTTTIAAPSGESRDFFYSVGVEVLGSDCVARVTTVDAG